MGFLSANHIPQKEWDELTINDSENWIERLVLKYKKCPSW